MNRLLLVCLIAIVWCLASCTDKEKIPAGVFPKDKMEKVLWDMIQAERYRETFVRDSAKDLKTETFKLYAQVFEIHQVSKDEFVNSYKFYMSRPDIARGMFDSLATRANRRRDELYKPKPVDTASVQQKVDSLKQADTAKGAVQPKPATTPARPATTPAQQPATTQPSVPKTLIPQFPSRTGKRFPLRKLKRDSVDQLQLKKQ